MSKDQFTIKTMMLQPLFLFPFLIGLLIALFTPENIFQQHPALFDCYLTIKQWFAWIEHKAEYSSFPNATRLFLAVNWILMPLQVFALTKLLLRTWDVDGMIRNLISNAKELKFIGIKPKYWVPFAVLLIFPGMFYFAFSMGEDPGFSWGVVNHHRVGMLLIWSFVYPISIASFIAITLLLIRNHKKIYFN